MQQQGMQQQGMQQQQSFPNQNGGFPNANPMQQNYYGQQMPLNYGMQGQGQQLTIGGYQQPMMQQQPGMYNQQYQQPMMQGGIGMGYNNTQMAFNQTPQYQQTASKIYFIFRSILWSASKLGKQHILINHSKSTSSKKFVRSHSSIDYQAKEIRRIIR